MLNLKTALRKTYSIADYRKPINHQNTSQTREKNDYTSPAWSYAPNRDQRAQQRNGTEQLPVHGQTNNSQQQTFQQASIAHYIPNNNNEQSMQQNMEELCKLEMKRRLIAFLS